MNAVALRRVSGLVGILTALLGLVVLLGWILGAPSLTAVLPGATAMKANTALCFILSGAALRIAAGGGLGRTSWVGIACSALVLLASGLTLAEYLGGHDLGIDQTLARDTTASRATSPGRMGPNTAVAFLLLGTSLLLLLGRLDRSRLAGASLLGSLAAVLGGFAVAGYMGDVAIGHGWSDAISMSLLTGMCFLVTGTTCFALAWRLAGLQVAIGSGLLAGFALGLAVLIALGVVSYKSARRFAETGDWVRHTVEVLAHLGDVNAHLSQSQIAARAFVATGREEFLKLLQEALARLAEDERTLRRLTSDNPVQQARLDTLGELIRQRRSLWAETVELYRRQGAAAAAASISAERGQAVMDQVGSLVGAMERTEQGLLVEREEHSRRLTARTFLILPVGTFAGVSVLLAVLFSLNLEVAERQRAQRASREAAANLRSTDEAVNQLGARLTTTLENMSNAFFTVDREWRFTYLNRECERLLHRTRADLLGKVLWDEFKEAIGGPSDLHYHRSMSENRAVAFEEFYPPLGMWLEVTAHPSSEGLAVYFHDVTERKQAVERLRDSEERFSAAFRSSPAAFAINRRRDQICLEVNDSFLRLFEVPREEVIGHTLVGLGLLDEGNVASLRRELTDTGAVDNAEVPARTRSGRSLTISLSVRVIQVGGEPCAISIILDVTERRRAEESIKQFNAELEHRVIERTEQLEAANAELRHSRAELNSLFESLPGLYLVLTPALEIVAASDAYLKATLTTREAILGRGLFQVFPDNPDDPGTTAVSNMQASIDRVLQNAAPDTMAIQKHDVRGADGAFEERYWSPINSPVFGADRRIKYIVHRVEEVTDFVRQQAQSARTSADLSPREQQMAAEIFQSSQSLQATNQQLEAANKELEAFSYSVSHDLRAPLRTVDGFSQALLEDFGPQLPEEGQRQVRTIRAGAQRMGALIDDLLAFSRLGRQALRAPVSVDMERLVHECLEELRPEQGERRIEIRTGPLPPSRGETAMIKQVWANLLSNAIKYTRPRDPALIEIGSVPGEREIAYFVRDNGTGFDMKYAHKLFGVFQRLHRAEDFEGTGVGLAVVQRIVQRHGGRVWAESEVDLGATFHFALPKGAGS